MTCPLWPPISLLTDPGAYSNTTPQKGEGEVHSVIQATESHSEAKMLLYFPPSQDQNHTSAEQWPRPQPQLGWVQRTSGTPMGRKATPSDKALLRLTSPGSKSQPPSLTWTKKACFPVPCPNPSPPSPPSPGVLLVLETDERPCVRWPFRCGEKKNKNEEPQICLFFNLMEDQGCAPLPHCYGRIQTSELCNAETPETRVIKRLDYLLLLISYGN